MKQLRAHSLIILSVAGALLVASGCGKQRQSSQNASIQEDSGAGETAAAAPSKTAEKQLPKLLDLGAHKCIACQMLAPVLDELAKEYKGRMEVEFIDVWEDPAAGHKYGIQQIPTQIFFGSDGRELFRHVGFMSKDDILAKWKELGYTFPEKDEKQ